MLKQLRQGYAGLTNGPGEEKITPKALGDGKKPKRKARLVKPPASKGSSSNVIVVAIPKTFVKSEVIQTSKKLNLGGNFNIPVGGAKNNIVIYMIEIRKGAGDSWKLEKTYKDFAMLKQRISEKFPVLNSLASSFPKKKMFSSPTPEQIEFRKRYFQGYLQALLQLKPRVNFVNDFLEVHQHTVAKKKDQLNIDDFELLKLLGKGSFGKVFLVRVIGSTDLYAMKVLRKSEVKKRKQVEHTKTELRVMGEADHPFICTLRFAFYTETRLFMVSDFCQGGELFFHLKTMRHFNNNMVQFYAAEISLALAYLHEKNIIYRDIKPENVLLDDAGHIRITDFGLSRDNVTDSDGATTFCGTPEYLSPEMLLGRQKGFGYGKSVDWWGLGVLIYEMFFGWPPFYDKNKKVMCRKILRGRLVFKSRISDEAKDIITGLLQREPKKRLGICGNGFEDLQQHPFFEGIDWERLYERQIEPPFKPNVSKTTENFDREFTDQSARISAHENLDDDDEEMNEGDEFDDFTFSRPFAEDFWEA